MSPAMSKMLSLHESSGYNAWYGYPATVLGQSRKMALIKAAVNLAAWKRKYMFMIRQQRISGPGNFVSTEQKHAYPSPPVALPTVNTNVWLSLLIAIPTIASPPFKNQLVPLPQLNPAKKSYKIHANTHHEVCS